MFEKLKQLSEMRKIQEQLSKERVEVEKEGIRVVLNGRMEVEEVVLNAEMPREREEKILKDCLNEASKKIQLLLAKKISQSPGFGI